MKCRSKIGATNNCYGKCRSCSCYTEPRQSQGDLFSCSDDFPRRMAIERESCAIAQFEEGSIEEESILEGKT